MGAAQQEESLPKDDNVEHQFYTITKAANPEAVGLLLYQKADDINRYYIKSYAFTTGKNFKVDDEYVLEVGDTLKPLHDFVNHLPHEVGKKVPYTLFRYKFPYDIWTVDGEVHKNCYPNGNSFHYSGGTVNDKKVTHVAISRGDRILNSVYGVTNQYTTFDDYLRDRSVGLKRDATFNDVVRENVIRLLEEVLGSEDPIIVEHKKEKEEWQAKAKTFMKS